MLWNDVRLVVAIGLALVLLSTSGAAQSGRLTVERPYDWPVSEPEEQGVPASIVDQLLSGGEPLSYLYSILVVKNGYLIAERYYGDASATDANTVMSVSKSVLSALVGLAEKQGYLDVDQPMLDFFPEHAGDLDVRKQSITVRHLLTMTAGYPRDDYEDEWHRWMESPDWVAYCLRQPLEGEPGESWRYSTCSTHIASALLARSTGMPTRRFARKNLVRKLGIGIGGWPVDPQGVHRGGWDMYLAPRDLARFGSLYLGNGRLEGRRIVPRQWVRRTTRTNILGTGAWGELESWGYGYWWWTGGGPQMPRIYFALGYGGQFLINVPILKMTIVATADGRYAPQEANDHEMAILGLIIRDLLRPLAAARASVECGECPR